MIPPPPDQGSFSALGAPPPPSCDCVAVKCLMKTHFFSPSSKLWEGKDCTHSRALLSELIFRSLLPTPPPSQQPWKEVGEHLGFFWTRHQRLRGVD